MKNSERLLHGADHYVTSPFGYRINPVTKKSEGHNGTDYGTHGKKVPCYAVTDGSVARVGKDKFGANFVYVRYPTLKKVGLYYHLDCVDVKEGNSVNKDTKIGSIGTTGQSTGVHLHFSWIEENVNFAKYYEANYMNYETYKFEGEEEDMTEAEVRTLVKRMLRESKEPASEVFAKEWEDAKSLGITEGSNPQAYPTREQVAAMVVRGIKIIKK